MVARRIVRASHGTARFIACAVTTAIMAGLVVGAAASGAPSDQLHAASAPYPRIAMLWSAARLPATRNADKLANWARHSIIVNGVDDFGLEWTKEKFPAIAETIDASSIAAGRRTIARLHELNPDAIALFEIYFYEANEPDYRADSPWWFRDKNGQRTRFWPGCYDMDLSNDEYIEHIARRIAAAYTALGGRAGVYLDNLRFDATAKAGWTKLLTQVRKDCGDIVILVNAGWDSDDLAWVAPLVNGIMYEDSVAHLPGKAKDTEAYYARIAATDRLLRKPRVSINERFGPRQDEARMMRELVRTLAYTDMAFLYSVSTDGHDHGWWPQWDARLGNPTTRPATPTAATLARRTFDRGEVLWLPATATQPWTVELNPAMHVAGGDERISAAVSRVVLQPGRGVILLCDGESPQRPR